MDEPYRPFALRVMAEHIGDDGVWDADPDRHGPVTLDDLCITAGLARRLRAWNRQYQGTALTDFEFASPEDERRWVQEGLKLAYELQNELPDIDISYAHDDDGRPVRERRGP
ncbi:hypothetical protein GCM10010172_67710 [Paractinoplanes ferrugineus]|uniref:Uncharacterized protein n=1 Tax=Paractinoplanes ferrugineus TaxID=113564 RepID=A0A919MES3_9ACTN|nr:hypothetical protein [Actinoplanes ferrugineus]GIE13068.1 hypothetical protein Afe05nite_49080 [Actinoplanes ferrugineus]